MLSPADDVWTLNEAAHLLGRAGFGGSPSQVTALHARGRRGAVDWLLEPAEDVENFPAPAWADLEAVRATERERAMRRREISRGAADMTPEAVEKARREANRAMRQESRAQGIEAQRWWFERMLRTETPLREKMTLFWHDHFATSLQKVRQPGLLVRQNELFRRHATGSFRDLVGEVCTDPAMMLYLDAQNSRRGKPNENFARELFELFTLGADGGYTEDDIRDAARAFTGYRIDRVSGTVRHFRRQWDGGEKTIFGETGRFAGEDVVDLVFEKRAPERFLAAKLWELFADEAPPEGAVGTLAETMRESDHRIAPALRRMFLSREFYRPETVRSQIKCPVQFLVQLLKELEITTPPGGYPHRGQTELGQVLFMPPNVAGWDWGKAWINTNTLLARYNIAGSITGAVNGARPRRGAMRRWRGPNYRRLAPPGLRRAPEALVDSLAARFFGGAVPERARESFLDYAKSRKSALHDDEAVAGLCHLMLSTPYYQLT